VPNPLIHIFFFLFGCVSGTDPSLPGRKYQALSSKFDQGEQ